MSGVGTLVRLAASCLADWLDCVPTQPSAARAAVRTTHKAHDAGRISQRKDIIARQYTEPGESGKGGCVARATRRISTQ